MKNCIATKTLAQISTRTSTFPRIFTAASRLPLSRRCMHHTISPPTLLRNPLLSSRFQSPPAHAHASRQCRHESTERAPRPLTDRPETVSKPDQPKEDVPSYEMTFTCRVCVDRSTHRITKQGYHHGTILITCPGCKNRHLISDHLKIFSDKGITIEDILKDKGQLLKKGSLGSEGDVEFWEDGTQTDRDPSSGSTKS